jgi:hypothetical protein
MALELDRAALDHFARLIAPLVALGDADSMHALLARLGWDADALGVDATELAGAVSAIEDTITLLDSLVDKEKITIGDLGNALTQVAIDAKEIFDAVNSLSGVDRTILGKLGEDVAGFIVIHYLASTWPKLCIVLRLLGILPTETVPSLSLGNGTVVRTAVTRPVLDLDILGDALRDPLGYIRGKISSQQGASSVAVAAADVIGPLLVDVLIDAGVATSYGSAPDIGRPALTADEQGALAHLLVTDFAFATDSDDLRLRLVAGLDDLGVAHPNEVGLLLGIDGGISYSQPTPIGTFTLSLGAGGALLISAYSISPAGGAGGGADFHFRVGYATDTAVTPALRFGPPDGLRFEIGSIATSLAIDAGAATAPDFSGTVDLKDVLLAIQGGDGDGFLAKVLPSDPIIIKADLGMDVGLRTGVRFRASAEFEKRIQLNLVLGPLKIPEIQVALGLNAGGAKLKLTGTIGLALGPLQAVVDHLGLSLTLRQAPADPTGGSATGNVGKLDVVAGFQPPAGAGMSISAGPVTGGGYIFFDPDDEEYAGVLQLSFKTIGLTVIGLLTTRLPDPAGPPGAFVHGFSLLLIITFDLPPIQLGYGFTLNGVGGLLGINRTMVVDALRNGVRTGAVDSILFPSNPVGRAAEIISDLRTIFPPAEGRYVFGPMVKIGWGPNAILELQAAVVLELTAPIRLVILGKVQLALPDKKNGVAFIRLDIVGVIDFDKSEVSVDASLVDSRITVFAITGDMALRVGWGATKIFALAAGGFHPKFTPPAGFPDLRRLAIALANSDNPRLRMESYFALTANTLQFGAGLDIYASIDTFAGTFSFSALANFDALIQFQPFELQADLGASVDISRNSTPFLHAALHASLTGPDPWHATGYAEFDCLGKHRIAFEATIGQPAPAPPLTVALPDLARRLADAFSRPDAWAALPPDEGARVVTLRDQPDGGRTLVHPLGALSARQRELPLDKKLERFGAAIVDPVTFTLTGFEVGGQRPPRDTLRDDFAPGQFSPLTDDEQVARPAFEAMKSGGTVDVDAVQLPVDDQGHVISAPTGTPDSNYTEVIVDRDPVADRRVVGNPTTTNPAGVFTDDVAASLRTGGAAGFARTRADGDVGFAGTSHAIKVGGERYVAAGVDDLAPLAGGPTGGASAAEAYDDIAAAPPRTRGSAQVALAHEAGP